MGPTQASTIVDIVHCTTITQFNDVIGIHAMVGTSLGAPVPVVVHCLTPRTGPGHHLSPPGSELGRGVDRILDLG
jgi:hypothetical protein